MKIISISIASTAVLLLAGCGGTHVEYIDECEERGTTISFKEQMGYLTDYQMASTDSLTYDIGRTLNIFVYESGQKNSDIDSFSLYLTPIKTDEKQFNVVECYQTVNSGLVKHFVGNGQKRYVLESVNGIKSTMKAPLSDE